MNMKEYSNIMSNICEDCKKAMKNHPYIILHDMKMGYWTTEEEVLKGHANRKDIVRTYCICTTQEKTNE